MTPSDVVTAMIGTGMPLVMVRVTPLTVRVNSCAESRMLAMSRLAPAGGVNVTSIVRSPLPALARDTSIVPPPPTGAATLTVGAVTVAAGSGTSTTSKVTSCPEELRKPIFNLP